MESLPLNEVSNDEMALLDHVLERLDRVLTAADRFVPEVAEPPVDGSPLAVASATTERDAFDLARLLLVAAGDHLGAILLIRRGRILPSFALYTLLRGGAEATVRASHLLDLSIDHRTRLARALTERFVNIEEQGKVLEDAQHEAARVAHLVQRAEALSIPVRRNDKGKVIAFGRPRPSLTDLFEAALHEGTLAYRVLSAYAHSMQWVLLPTDRAVPSAEAGVALVSTEVDLNRLIALLYGVLDAFDEAVRRWVVLAGQPAEVWRLAKEGPGN